MTLLLISLALLLILGLPIAYSLGISGFLYFMIKQPMLLAILPQRLYAGMESYSMIALPLFCLMGYLMNAGGITARLIDFSLIFVGRFRGGLGLVNVLSSMIFGGISGSSVSDTASVGAVLIPEMKKKGYSVQFSSGITVASSTMGMIIPQCANDHLRISRRGISRSSFSGQCTPWVYDRFSDVGDHFGDFLSQWVTTRGAKTCTN